MENENKISPTPEQIEAYCQKLIENFKKDPKWELQQELGKMLIRNIDTFTEDERKRYDELLVLLG